MNVSQKSTKEFVEKIHEAQAKDRENKEHNGYGHPEKRLPNKQGIH